MSNLTQNKLPDDIVQHIEHLERVRRDFIANVSHELRTPLTVIRGYLEALIEQNDGKNPSWDNIFKQMHQHSLRMEHIITDLLFLSRLETTEQEVVYQKKLPIANILTAICEDARQLSQQQHHISLTKDSDLYLDGIAEELKSLFYNLIGNAVKYTPKGGKIEVVWKREKDQACFKVIDNGIGIEKKDIPRITERFYRVVKARSRDSGGTGLGLAIVKHVLLRHQGELIIRSELGKGSEFCCLFSKEMVSVGK